jgi:hypothetical protein
MNETFTSTQNHDAVTLTDEMEFERDEFLTENAPDKSFFELDNERKQAEKEASIEDRNRALANYAKLNLSFNGYTENID